MTTVPLPSAGDSDWYDWGAQVDDQGRAADTHRTSTANPHSVTKAQVGLGNVDNTADTAKPLSTAATTALAGKAAASHTHGVADLPTATASAKGLVQLTGDLAGTATAPTVVRRAPVGGVQTPTYAATYTPNAGAGNHVRIVATGDLTINAPTGGDDGQRLLIEVQASGANRTVTFASALEVSQAVPGRVFTISSGTWAYVTLVNRSGTWRLVAAEPQTTSVTLPATSQWLPSDHGLLAWTNDPLTSIHTIQNASGAFVACALKLDQAATVSNILCTVLTAGSGFTASTSYVGLYSMSTGARLGLSADLATTLNSTGNKTIPLVTPVAASAGVYAVAVISTATTMPVFQGLGTYSGAMLFGRTTSAYRLQSNSGSFTSLPTTKPAATGVGNCVWFGLS